MLADLAAGNRLLRLIMFIRSQLHKRRSHLARASDRHIPAICDKRPASAAHMGVRTKIMTARPCGPRRRRWTSSLEAAGTRPAPGRTSWTWRCSWTMRPP